MPEDSRGRIQDPHPIVHSISRKPSPGLAARIKMLEADAEKRNASSTSNSHGIVIIRDRLSPSPSSHRSLSRTRTSSISAGSDMSVVSSAIDVPTSIPTTNGEPRLSKNLPPTPIDDHMEHHEHADSADSADRGVLDESEDTPSAVHVHKPSPPVAVASPGKTRPGTSHSVTTNDSCAARTSSGASSPVDNHYNSPQMSSNLHRRASVYSLSRISFAAQLSRLTSLSLPLSSDLSAKIRDLPTSQEACDSIIAAGKQISRWIETAKNVLDGLDAEDDVEWAAQGRESMLEVDTAVSKFHTLVTVYVTLIEELQSRPDRDTVDSNVLDGIVSTMEGNLNGWDEVRDALKEVKGQVETALEWTELWTTILQDIQAELEACQTLVFEMEEKRHRSMMEDGGTVDIDTLETIMEEDPISAITAVNGKGTESDDSCLLGLFARMQPLRASLDFLPMRLASFEARAKSIFPSACEDLISRRKTLEKKWKKLNSDAESLKKELGEDRWVIIFRNAGKQAGAMIDSVERSLQKLTEAVAAWEESGGGRVDKELGKRMESYEAKKTHYGTAIQRTMGIISKGVSDRITVNGEIIRLDSAIRTRWKSLEMATAEMDQYMYYLQIDTQTLRDSVSSVTTLDARSFNGSGFNTPGSSPASSVNLTPSPNILERKSPASGTRRPTSATGHRPQSRNLSLNTSSSSIPRKSAYARLSSTGDVSTVSVRNKSSPTTSAARMLTSPTGSLHTLSKLMPPSKLDNRPRWNSSTNTNDGIFSDANTFKPLSLTTPSPYAKSPVIPRRGTTPGPTSNSRLPMPSPLAHSSPKSPTGSTHSRHNSAALRLKSPSPAPRKHELRSKLSMSRLGIRRSSNGSNSSGEGASIAGTDFSVDERPRIQVRPASAMATGGTYGRSSRSSMLPRPKTPGISAGGNVNKRMSMPPGSMNPVLDRRPKWRI